MQDNQYENPMYPVKINNLNINIGCTLKNYNKNKDIKCQSNSV